MLLSLIPNISFMDLEGVVDTVQTSISDKIEVHLRISYAKV